MKKNKRPKVSIGLPVYNGEATIVNTLNTIRSQSFANFELIISDNCSTDDTQIICEKYALADSRIRYYRQKENLGPLKNFYFVLTESVGEYFIWIGADDSISFDFLEHNLNFLNANLDYVASISKVRFTGLELPAVKMGDANLHHDDLEKRVKAFFLEWHANSALYSLMRAEVIKRGKWRGESYLGIDWIIMLDVVIQGRIKRLEKGWIERGVFGESNSGDLLKKYRYGLLELLLPFWELSWNAFRLCESVSLTTRLTVIIKCLKLNYLAIKMQFLECISRICRRWRIKK